MQPGHRPHQPVLGQDRQSLVDAAIVELRHRGGLILAVAEAQRGPAPGVKAGLARGGKLVDECAGAVARGVQAPVRSVGGHAEVGGGTVRARQQEGLPDGSERGARRHHRCRVGPAGVVPVHDGPLPADLLLVDGVVRRVDHQLGVVGAEDLAGQCAQRAVGCGPEREAIVHRGCIRQQHALALRTLDRDGRAAVGEVKREPLP